MTVATEVMKLMAEVQQKTEVLEAAERRVVELFHATKAADLVREDARIALRHAENALIVAAGGEDRGREIASKLYEHRGDVR